MKSRGPDSYGFFHNSKVSMGHRRLSIIDLSVRGNQPMQDSEGNIKRKKIATMIGPYLKSFHFSKNFYAMPSYAMLSELLREHNKQKLSCVSLLKQKRSFPKTI